MTNIYVRVRGWKAVLAFAAVLACAVAVPGLAGELEPPVPPGTPTMKPLNELEPRRPIYAHLLPLTISEAGSSWYMAESITTTGGGITVSAANVTIDLMGFMLEGGTGIGIRDDVGGNTGIGTTIMNGYVSGWSSHGISLGHSATVKNLAADHNGGNGIQIAEYGRLIDCTSTANDGHGFDAGFGADVRRCRAHANSENGIITSNLTSIVNFTATVNDRNGIRIGDSCVVTDSLSTGSDRNNVAGGAGIWVVGDSNRIEGNQIDGNNIGIHLDGNKNIIVRNTLPDSRGNVYDIDPGATDNYMPNYTVGSAGAPGPLDNLCNDDSCP